MHRFVQRGISGSVVEHVHIIIRYTRVLKINSDLYFIERQLPFKRSTIAKRSPFETTYTIIL